MNLQELFKSTSDGDDVPTIVGIAKINAPDKAIDYATIIIDYATASPKVQEQYTKIVESDWTNKSWDSGFNMIRKSPQDIHVETRDRYSILGLDGKEEHHLKQPFWWTLCSGHKPVDLDKFTEMASLKEWWILHLRTAANSFMIVIHTATGMVVQRTKTLKVQFDMAGGGA